MAKILVVEDNEPNREMIRCRLAWEGHDIVTAERTAGMRLAQTEQPDVVLIDLGWPVRYGVEAASLFKQHSGIGHIPVIALSAASTSTDRAQLFSAGCEAFEAKPINFTQLLLKIAQLTGAAG